MNRRNRYRVCGLNLGDVPQDVPLIIGPASEYVLDGLVLIEEAVISFVP
jgi:hypothetical protein